MLKCRKYLHPRFVFHAISGIPGIVIDDNGVWNHNCVLMIKINVSSIWIIPETVLDNNWYHSYAQCKNLVL